MSIAIDIPRPKVIVHSRAFSHRKVALDIASATGGIVVGYDAELDTFASKVVVVSTIDYIDIALSSKFIVPASECLFYGVAEGEPVLSPRSRSVINSCSVVVPSRYVEGLAGRVGVRVDDVVPHAVVYREPDYHHAKRIRYYVLDKVDGCRWLVGWVGANQRRKGLDVLLEVASMFSNDVCFAVLTGGGEIPLDNVPGNVVVLDMVYRLDNIFDFYYAVDVFLSTSRNEGFGLPVFEALLADKPVVANSIPVYREYLDGFIYMYRYKSVMTELYKGYMWMEYYEPDIDDLYSKIREAIEGGPIDGAKEYVEQEFSLDVYERLRI